MKGPSRLMRMTLRHSSTSVSQVLALAPAMPALLTRMSMRPSALTVASQASATLAGSATSQPMATTAAPSARAVSRARGTSRSQIATRAPDATNRSVIALPKPWAPPVTTAERPSRPMSLPIRASPLAPPSPTADARNHTAQLTSQHQPRRGAAGCDPRATQPRGNSNCTLRGDGRYHGEIGRKLFPKYCNHRALLIFHPLQYSGRVVQVGGRFGCGVHVDVPHTGKAHLAACQGWSLQAVEAEARAAAAVLLRSSLGAGTTPLPWPEDPHAIFCEQRLTQISNEFIICTMVNK